MVLLVDGHTDHVYLAAVPQLLALYLVLIHQHIAQPRLLAVLVDYCYISAILTYGIPLIALQRDGVCAVEEPIEKIQPIAISHDETEVHLLPVRWLADVQLSHLARVVGLGQSVPSGGGSVDELQVGGLIE